MGNASSIRDKPDPGPSRPSLNQKIINKYRIPITVCSYLQASVNDKSSSSPKHAKHRTPVKTRPNLHINSRLATIDEAKYSEVAEEISPIREEWEIQGSDSTRAGRDGLDVEMNYPNYSQFLRGDMSPLNRDCSPINLLSSDRKRPKDNESVFQQHESTCQHQPGQEGIESDEEFEEVFENVVKASVKKHGVFVLDAGPDEDTKLPFLGAKRFTQTLEIYKGQWKNGKRHGKGYNLWSDGSIYQGYWQNDLKHGRGRHITSDGTVFEGNWKDNMLHGRGKYLYSNGKSYEGELCRNNKHGYGIEVTTDKVIYEGYFEMGAKKGNGRQIWPDGSVYIGEFSEGVMHGVGILEWADGRSYEGEWRNKRMHGKGEFSWSDGRRYKGEYDNDMKHGYGEFEFENGKKYVGPFVKDKIHGEGMFYGEDGEVKKGIWKYGGLVKWL